MLSIFKSVAQSPDPLESPTTVSITGTSRRPAYGIDTTPPGSLVCTAGNAVAIRVGGPLKSTDADSGYSSISGDQKPLLRWSLREDKITISGLHGTSLNTVQMHSIGHLTRNTAVYRYDSCRKG